MIIKDASHLDHGLTEAHGMWLINRYRDRDAFFIETIELPENLPAIPCGLHGPAVGDAPVPDSECKYVRRAGRARESRTCKRAPQMTRTITVIAGPHDGDPCVLFTAYGGPLAPREPWDASMSDAQRAESIAFWAQHALSI